MKQFQNVESKVTTNRPGTATTRGGIPRPPQQQPQQPDSARSRPQQPATIAFGKATRTGSACATQQSNKAPSALATGQGLTSKNLNLFDRRTNSIGFKKPVDPEVVVFTGEEAKIAAFNAANMGPAPDATPVHKNFGKVPKYI